MTILFSKSQKSDNYLPSLMREIKVPFDDYLIPSNSS